MQQNWATRFKKASADKRRATDGGLGQVDLERDQRTRVAGDDIQSARTVDPTDYLEAVGYTVKRSGARSLSVRLGRAEIYRVTRCEDGNWLWCDNGGDYGGDNIKLAREIEPGIGFAEAVCRLLGTTSVSPQPRRDEPKRTPPSLPRQDNTSRSVGRAYLANERGISVQTIDHAEACGMVRYSRGGVLFIGYDDAGTAQNITRRAVDSTTPEPQKNITNSDKSFPCILPGSETSVWIVEGGMDAMALHDMAKRCGQEPPTVIVSGGAGVVRCLDRDNVKGILRRAERVTVAGENEKKPSIQAKTDAGHQKQAQRVSEITGREVRQWTPKPEQGKDLADMNQRIAPLSPPETHPGGVGPKARGGK